MASINIGGGDDAFNRYKMPPVVGKVEGKGNGIKTRIANCDNLAKALHRPPGYVCKFFGCELGALTKIDEKEGTFIVNGAFEDVVLQETVTKFIEMFVLCAECKLPETDIKVKKSGDIRQICNACGADSLCDMSHKLCTFIVNNPPDGKKKKDASGKLSKAERRAKKQAAVESAHTGNGNGKVEDDEEAARKARRAAKKAAKKAAADAEAAAALTAQNGAAAGDDDDDDDEWSVDMSKEAQEARARSMGGSAAALLERTSIVDDMELADKLRSYMDEGKKPKKVAEKSAKIFDGEEYAVRGIMAASLLKETPATAEKAVAERAAPNLAFFGGTPMAAERQIEAMEYFDFWVSKDLEALKMIPFVLKSLYDTDLVEEETIMAWYKRTNGRQDVRDALREIIEWLEEASEEESGDEDEEDDEDSE